MRVNGGLNLVSNLIDKPRKSGIDGSQVQDLYFDGHAARINDYCRCDVLDTYFVFLRTRVLIGRLGLEDEDALVAETREMLESHADEHPAYAHYLEFWDRRLKRAERRQAAAEEDGSSVDHATEAESENVWPSE